VPSLQEALRFCVRVREYNVVFETGQPVSFPFVRNTERAGNFGKTFQQDIEPTGIYLLHSPHKPPVGWEHGTVMLDAPLVIPFNTQPSGGYDENSWKAVLQKKYRAKGKALSRQLITAGYDSVVTVGLNRNFDPEDTREIVLLRIRGR
jgi:hypothetical protein